jgi:uncharacterized phiE125 gp8 family phage protein
MSVRQLTLPAQEPVTLTQCRLWCRIDDDDTGQDAVLLLIMQAARERAEEITGVCLAQRTFEVTLDSFPTDAIELPYPPVVSVQYLTYFDTAGDMQTLTGSPDNWILDISSQPARISPLWGESWPGTATRVGAIKVGYTAGYSNPNDVPKRFLLWIQARVSTWYENREHLQLSNLKEAPRDYVDGVLDTLRVGFFFA